jgi:hypothetical protein
MPVHRQRTFDLPDASVGTALWAARLRSGMDLRTASDAAGIDWRVLSRVERGERPCRVTELVALSGVYHVNPDLMVRAITGDAKARQRLGLETADDG